MLPAPPGVPPSAAEAGDLVLADDVQQRPVRLNTLQRFIKRRRRWPHFVGEDGVQCQTRSAVAGSAAAIVGGGCAVVEIILVIFLLDPEKVAQVMRVQMALATDKAGDLHSPGNCRSPLRNAN